MTKICDTRAITLGRTDFFQAKVPARATIINDPKVSGGKLYRIETRVGEYTLSGDVPGAGQLQGKGRCEALVGNSHVGSSSQNFGYDPQEGDNYWHYWEFEWPSTEGDQTLAGNSTGDNMIMTQTNSYDSTGHGSGMTAKWQQQDSSQALVFGPGAFSIPKAQFRFGHRYKIKWHAHWSTNSSVGYDEVWQMNDAETAWLPSLGTKFSNTLRTSSNGSPGVYHKFGMYHHFTPSGGGPWVEYHSGVQVATTEIEIDPLQGKLAPSAPVLTGSAGDTAVNLGWAAVPTATSYEVLKNGATVKTGITVLTDNETGLTNGTPYTFNTKARNANGLSGPSNTLTLTPTGITPPPPPPPPGDVSNFDTTALTWPVEFPTTAGTVVFV